MKVSVRLREMASIESRPLQEVLIWWPVHTPNVLAVEHLAITFVSDPQDKPIRRGLHTAYTIVFPTEHS